MMSPRTQLALLALIAPMMVGAALAPSVDDDRTAIDADVWQPVAKSVADGDIVAMGRVYHPDAVLVSAQGTRRIQDVLPEWGADIDDSKAKGDRATVEFRFTRRQDDAETAFETGAFKYTVIDRNGTASPSYTKMEALLVKRAGKWRILMERQLESVSEAAWNAISP